MVLALGMPENIPNTQGREIARTAECKYRSALGVDESMLEFWLPHLSGLYNDEVASTIEGNCSRVNFPHPNAAEVLVTRLPEKCVLAAALPSERRPYRINRANKSTDEDCRDAEILDEGPCGKLTIIEI